jgi:hypothetical protein
MVESLFDKLQAAAYKKRIPAQTKQSRDWFRGEVRGMRVKGADVLNDPNLEHRTRPAPGRMYTYFYDPKHKATLPYYDRFPLIIMVGPATKGFYGMNLHYLPIPLRAKFLDQLMTITNNKKFDESSRFKASYNFLKGSSKFGAFKPCFKHYLIHKVESEIKFLPADLWEIATFLPTARFKGATAAKVHSDSRKQIG